VERVKTVIITEMRFADNENSAFATKNPVKFAETVENSGFPGVAREYENKLCSRYFEIYSRK
jgi:hypothetical protein